MREFFIVSALRGTIPTIVVTVAAVAVLTGCGGGGSGGPPKDVPTEVVLAKPAQRPVEDIVTAVGTTEANERVDLKPEASGLVESVHFVEGQRIKRGTKLIQLDSEKEKAAVAQADAEERLAKSNVDRARTLVGTKAISAQELDQLESQVAVRAAMRLLEHERLGERVLYAPFDGVLGPRLVSPGQYITVGTPIGSLVDDTEIKVQFRLPERQLGRIELGQTGRLRVAAFDRVFNGKVDLIEPAVDALTRTILVRLRVPNPDGALRPGMFARVELVVGRRENALVVPERSVVPSLDRFSVFTVHEGRARLQPVVLGMRLPGEIEIREGLTADTDIVVTGTQKLVEGMRVVAATAPQPPAGAAAAATP